MINDVPQVTNPDSITSDLHRSITTLLTQLDEVDTAVMLTFLPTLNARLAHLKTAFDPQVLHCIAIKSNPHPKILETIIQQGFGLEAASIEEVRRALSLGCPSHKLVFDSPVKTRLEIAEVAQQDGLLVNVNTLSELKRFPKTTRCTIGIRINPLTDTGSPERFSVGRNESKFGVPIAQRQELIDAILTYPVTALHMHSGSQMRDLSAQAQALNALGTLAHDMNQKLVEHNRNRQIEILDIGGGLPSEPLSATSQMQSYGKLVHDIKSLDEFKLVTEFGQWLNAECGAALSRVEYVIDGQPSKLFIHLGADMFTRDAYTKARPFPLSIWTRDGQVSNEQSQIYDVAGPLCFAGDYVARQVKLPKVNEGDWLCIEHTGANTYSLWSRHCSRNIPAHWVWDGDRVHQWSSRQEVNY